jgi:TetR/AcrR family transcriptional repressor of bet genes
MTTDRRQQLLDALVDVMAERGWSGASVARIARRAQLAPGLVHYYFDRKLDLLLALAERLRHTLSERIDAGPGDLRGVIDAALALPGDPAAVRCAVVLGAEAVRDPEVREAWGAVLRWLRDQLEVHMSDEARASALLAAIVGSWQLGAMGCPPPTGTAADAVHALAVR